MSTPEGRIGKRVGLGAGVVAAFAVAILLLSGLSAAAGATAGPTPTASLTLRQAEMMPAFLKGQVVQTVYEQGYFVGSNVTYNSTYGPEPLLNTPAVGVNPVHYPSSHDRNATLWVLVPWWGPASAPYAPAYDPATYGIDEQCAPATIQICYDHPATIYVPGLGVVPLPGHDHLISFAANGEDLWWNVAVDLIYKQSAWPVVTPFGSSGITSLGQLQAAQKAGLSSPDLPTDLFLNFKVIVKNGVNTTVPSGKILQQLVMMPSFLGGQVVQTFYEQGYYVGTNATYNASFGMEPIFGAAAVGSWPTTSPAPWSAIKPFYVLVPWWGNASAPYAPAYNPAAYGIQEDCAPANVQVCWDHPAMINVPGLGTVPLPGHDHLLGTTNGGKDTWWNVVVVLVTNASAWPQMTVFGSSGIVSVGALHHYQAMGEASSDLPTNVFLNFWVA
jgi:hypothetical protein